MHFANYEEAEDWIKKHEAGRRQSTPQQEMIYLGEEYNEAKGDQGGDRKSDGSSGQNVHLIGRTAENIAENRSVDPKTVERAGKFAETLAKLESSLQTQIRDGKKVTDAQLKRCVNIPPDTQIAMARALRVGQAKDVKEAMQQCGVARKPTKKKPGKQTPAELLAAAKASVLEDEDDDEPHDDSAEAKAKEDNRQIESFCRALMELAKTCLSARCALGSVQPFVKKRPRRRRE